MPTPSSQGSTVSFAGSSIGNLTGFRFAHGSAVYQEVTNVTSPVVGTSTNSRIVKQYDCIAIEPGTCEVSLYGAPSGLAAQNQKGLRGSLVVSFAGSSYTMEAFLDSFEVAGNVGEFLNGTARFRITGF